MSAVPPPPPTSKRMPPKAPSRPLQNNGPRPHEVPKLASTRKIKPLIYAVGIAVIVVSGTLIGAYWKTDRQKEASVKARQALLQPQTPRHEAPETQNPAASSPAETEAAYSKTLEILQTRRAHLLAEKTGLETRLKFFRESQEMDAKKETQTKEFDLKR